MRLTACTIGLLAWISGSAGATDALDQIKDNCTREWGLDYAMMERCQERQVAAVREFITTRDGEATEDPYRMLLRNCYAEWTKRSGSDWPMVMRCYERQSDAFRRLQQD